MVIARVRQGEGEMTKLIEITGKALSGEWGSDDVNNTGIPVLRTTNFTNEGIVNFENVVTRTIKSKNLENKFLRDGDIIIEKSGGSDKQPVGRVIYYDGPDNKYLFNNFTGLLRVRKQNRWFSKYIFYSLFSNYKRGGTKAFENKTTGLHNLKIDLYISQHEVIDIDYSHQVTICRQLDRIREILSLRRRQLDLLDELVKARFVEMFGDPRVNSMKYPEVPLGTLVTDIIPGWSVNGELRQKTEEERAVLKVSAVTMGYFKPEEHKVLPNNLLIKKYVFPHKGDLLFSRANTRELVGATAIVDKDYPDLLLPDKLWRVLFSSSLNVYYAKYVLSSKSIREEFSAQSTGTSGSMFNVSAEKFRNITIPVPPIEDQDFFKLFVQQVEKQKARVRSALEESQLLFDSMMQRYFG